jgi:ribosomal-protein-serine acetyltransferase
MILKIDAELRLELIAAKHSAAVFELATANKTYLAEWLAWVENMHDIDFIRNFIEGSQARTANETEFAFVIKKNDKIVGRISVHKIDRQNKIGELGYWLAKSEQGQGIMAKAVQRIVNFCFAELHLQRIEIKCAVKNHKSQAIPRKLGFAQEGILREAELLHGNFHDLVLFAKISTK